MKILSVGMMTVTFVLGVGVISVIFVFGKKVVALAQDVYGLHIR